MNSREIKKEEYHCPCGAKFSPKHKWWHEKNSKEHISWKKSQSDQPEDEPREKARRRITQIAEKDGEFLKELSGVEKEIRIDHPKHALDIIENSIKETSQKIRPLRVKLNVLIEDRRSFLFQVKQSCAGHEGNPLVATTHSHCSIRDIELVGTRDCEICIDEFDFYKKRTEPWKKPEKLDNRDSSTSP